MINGISSLYFNSFVGVRQGDNLSPLLFALLLNDIKSICLSKQRSTLKYLDARYVRCNSGNVILYIFVLLCANATIAMAESETGLQTNLELLKAYCDLNKLFVNVSKTKVMVFTRSKSSLNFLPNFKFGQLCLERVDEYVYLGITFNYNGSFIKAIQILQIKAYKAKHSLIQNGRRLNLLSHIMLYLFDSCVVPILLYGCEVWGYESSVTMIELVHTKFCKFVFKVFKFTHDMMMYG